MQAIGVEAELAASVTPSLERPRQADHGDLATNLAMQLARPLKKSPRAVAEQLVAALMEQPGATDLIAQAEIAGPGFINFRLTPAAHQRVVHEVLAQGEQFGQQPSNGQQVMLEFVSANPTGPLHVGHGRQAALGDVLGNLLASQGWKVHREFYYNDAGAQIHNLALSVQARGRGIAPDDPSFPADGYRGDYIAEIARAFVARETVQVSGQPPETATGDLDDLDAVRRFAVACLRREQDLDLAAFGVSFDRYYLESSLYTDGKVEEAVARLVAGGHTFEQDGALWLRTTDYGDDKDRVMRKSDGTYTYFVPDVAYHLSKWQRGYERAITELGADHHGSLARVRAGLQALDAGIPQGWPEYVLHQMVTVMRGGEEVKLSKRAGSYVTLRDLIDEVGRDATRWFLVARRPDSQLVFDIDFARSQSLDNPVYYVQLSHARICGLLRQLEERGLAFDAASGLERLPDLDSGATRDLLTDLSRFPEVVEAAGQSLEPHLVAAYLVELAQAFQSYYNDHQFLVDDAGLRDSRLALALATRQVLANGLALLGVAAPQRM